MPSCYPDGTSRSPAFDDDEEEIGPAYYSSIRNRSPSCSRTPMTDIEQERHSLGPSAENENPVTSLWSSSLPEPRMFSNIFLQQQERALSAESVGQTEQQPTRRPVSAQEAAITVPAEPDESLPLPPPPQPPSVPPVSLNDDHETPDIIMIPPPPPAISPDAQPSSQPGADDQISIQDKNAKRRLTGTARVFSKKSRQDGLLEANPSPPRSPRRGISRSPGPHVPMSPFWKRPSTKTPAHEPDLENHVSASDSRTEFTCSTSLEIPRTPAYGSATPYSTQSPRYCSGSPTYGESALSLYGGRRSSARCATPYWNGGQSPIERPNTPSYARTPGQSSRPSTPRPPSYTASTPCYARDDLGGGSQVTSGGGTTQSRNDERRMDQLSLRNRTGTPPPPYMPPMYPMPPIPPPFPYMPPFGQNPTYSAHSQNGVYPPPPPPPPHFGGPYPLPPGFGVPYAIPPFGIPPPGFPLPGTSPATLPSGTNDYRMLSARFVVFKTIQQRILCSEGTKSLAQKTQFLVGCNTSVSYGTLRAWYSRLINRLTNHISSKVSYYHQTRADVCKDHHD
ncbi:unnamed protein product [Cylicocyclus nassatus]|uniref:Uncharacterized protein n=1 Tax=Cylicocyclus nassatus TaxID=53992 RepID=A0AA36H3T6_CYLNA|nr:unnamed protein product [Cylicocyclus nassatus]